MSATAEEQAYAERAAPEIAKIEGNRAA